MTAVSTENYVAVQQLYANLAAALDSGKLAEAADLFTEDAELSYAGLRAPVRGRAAILEDLVAHNAAKPDPLAQRRHWFGQFRLSAEDGVVSSDAYALIVSTELGDAPKVVLSGEVHDRIVFGDGGCLFQRRVVSRDGI